MICKGLLLISLPLTGFMWALPSDPTVIGGATLLTLLSIGVGVGAELLAASNEAELNVLGARRAAMTKQRAEELEIRDEKIRQFDRVAALLTEQNHALRAKLISLQVEIQNQRAPRRAAEPHTATSDPLPAALRNAAGSRSS